MYCYVCRRVSSASTIGEYHKAEWQSIAVDSVRSNLRIGLQICPMRLVAPPGNCSPGRDRPREHRHRRFCLSTCASLLECLLMLRLDILSITVTTKPVNVNSQHPSESDIMADSVQSNGHYCLGLPLTTTTACYRLPHDAFPTLTQAYSTKECVSCNSHGQR